MAHPELGRKILDDVITAAGPSAKVENMARMEGRSMSMVLAPDKKAQDALKKAQAEAERKAVSDSETSTTTESPDTTDTPQPGDIPDSIDTPQSAAEPDVAADDDTGAELVHETSGDE